MQVLAQQEAALYRYVWAGEILPRGSIFVSAWVIKIQRNLQPWVVFQRHFLIHNGLKIGNTSVSGDIATVEKQRQ